MNDIHFYKVIFVQPGINPSNYQYQSFESFNTAIAYSKILLSEPNRIRTSLFYSIDYSQNIELIGSMGRDMKYIANTI